MLKLIKQSAFSNAWITHHGDYLRFPAGNNVEEKFL